MRYKNEYNVVVEQEEIQDGSNVGVGVRGNTSHAIHKALMVLPEVLQKKFVKTYNNDGGKL